MERGGWKPQVEICPACPRCGSSNTKFCYYNNYSLTQPRYFCKGCRRYWTKGGSLRNVPVGGGCRKTRRGNKAVRIARHGVSSGTSITGCHSRGSLNSMTDPTTYAAPSNNIDLAVVYANFLNQQPQPEKITLNECIEILPPMPDASNHPVFGMEYFGSQEALSDWSLDTEAHSKDLLYICGLEQKQHNIHIATDQHMISNFDLPPLPGEEVIASEENMVNNPNQFSNGMHFLGFESEADIDLDPSDRSEFLRNTSMLPTYGKITRYFSRP